MGQGERVMSWSCARYGMEGIDKFGEYEILLLRTRGGP